MKTYMVGIWLPEKTTWGFYRSLGETADEALNGVVVTLGLAEEVFQAFAVLDNTEFACR